MISQSLTQFSNLHFYSLLPNLDRIYYQTGAYITITYIVVTLIERYTNTEVTLVESKE